MSATTTITALGVLIHSCRTNWVWNMNKIVERTDFTFTARSIGPIEAGRGKTMTLRNVIRVARALIARPFDIVRFFQRNREGWKYQGRKCQGTRP